MADNIQDRLRDVQTRRSAAQSQRARDEVEVANATAALAAARASLKDEFEIVTSEDLKRVRAELQTELESALTEAEEQLTAAGA